MATASRWLVCFEPVPNASVRLFCFPYAGGGAAVYRSWRTELPKGVELWAVRPPGREMRYKERAYHRMDPLVEALERELEPVLDRPHAFFGHSVGAVTAFEVARRLERRGCGPRRLLVSAHRAPHLPQTVPLVHLAPDDVIIGRMRRFGGTPEVLYQQDDLMSALLPNLRADFALSETYRYTDPTPLRCALTAFGGTDDHMATEVTIEGWEDVTAGRFRAHVFEGGHFYWLDDPTPLLQEISADLVDSFPELQ